jgi:hypothetical protein
MIFDDATSRTVQTYELHIHHPDGEVSFEPLLCSSAQEVISVVRRMIETRGLAAVDVRFMGRTLFTLRS